jgi:hypothetical protein
MQRAQKASAAHLPSRAEAAISFRHMARYCPGNNEPLTRWNNHPVYLTTILTGLFIVGLVATAVLGAARSPILEWLIFTMPLVPAWSLWRLFTYVFIGQLSFFTPFAILCFYWWSMGIETHMGRRVLTRLLVLLALTGPAACVAWWMIAGPSVAGIAAIGNYAFTCGLLVAFATLYPNTEAWGWIPFKWLTFACVACGSLMLLASRSWIELSQLWASCAVGFAFMRHAKELEYDDYESPFARLGKLFQRKPKFRVLPKPANARRAVEEADEIESIDPLLDKIARSGMASLSAEERARLEKAREALMKKDRQ